MIRSMTGYGHADVAGVRLILSVECKSLNHRHLDIALRLPRGLSALELDARRLIQGSILRGRVEVSVAVGPLDGAPSSDLTLNIAQARAYIDMARRAGDELNIGGIPTLQWMLEQPGVITRAEQTPMSPDEGWPLLHDGLTRALGELRARRDTEGAALDREMRALLAVMVEQVGVMSARGPEATERKQQRLRDRIQALIAGTPVDESRLATEVAIWAEKSDITEELARLRAHMDEFARLLDEGGAVGRTLDFLIQEMNREVNTVGSKADDLELSQAAIAAKSTLEKLREQAQNIE